MSNINENNKALNISFNQDDSCFSISTEKGFKIFDTNSLNKNYEKDLGGGLILTEMYYKSNILALISGGEHPKFDIKKLIIWDASLNKAIGELNFFNFLKNVKMKKDKLFVINEKNIYVFDLKTLDNIEIINTSINPKGLFSINSEEKNDIIAYLAESNAKENNKSNFIIKIKNYGNSSEFNIDIKEDMISYISLNGPGNLVAIANDKGSEIKIYSCVNGELLANFLRGKEKAEINYICFDKLSNYLAVTSDRGTIHIWSLKTIIQKLTSINKDDKDNKDSNILTNEIKDLPENKKLIFSQNEKSFAKIRLKPNKSICSFQDNNIIVVITYQGKYYKALLDTKNGGDCQIIMEKDLKI